MGLWRPFEKAPAETGAVNGTCVASQRFVSSHPTDAQPLKLDNILRSQTSLDPSSNLGPGPHFNIIIVKLDTIEGTRFEGG
jgi:hypothetical protein